MSEEEIIALTSELESKLMKFYGSPVLTGSDLQKALGYRSVDALRQAILRKQFPIPLFKLENRRGKYALVSDIAAHLAKMRYNQNHYRGGENNDKIN